MEDEQKELDYLLEEIPTHTSNPLVNHGHDHLFNVQQSLIDDDALFNGVHRNLVPQENPRNHQQNGLFSQGFERRSSVGSSIDERFLLPSSSSSSSSYFPLESAFSRLTLRSSDMGFDDQGVYSPVSVNGFGGDNGRETCPSSFRVSGGSVTSSGLISKSANFAPYAIGDLSTNPQITSFLNRQSNNKCLGNCGNGSCQNRFTVGFSDSHVHSTLSSSSSSSLDSFRSVHGMNQHQYFYNQRQIINLERQLKAQRDYALARTAMARAYDPSFADPAQDANGCRAQGPCSSVFHRCGSSFCSGSLNSHVVADRLYGNNTIPSSVDNPFPNFLNLRTGYEKFSKYHPLHFQNSCFGAAEIYDREDRLGCMGHAWMRGGSHGLNNTKNHADIYRYGSHCNGGDNCKVSIRNAFQFDKEGPPSEVLEAESPPRLSTGNPQQQKNYTSLDQVIGQMVSVAKDQEGCRFLQERLVEGLPEELELIFSEITRSICELMVDPFGNYLVQKLLDACNEEQRMKVVREVTRKEYDLIDISLNNHGTRAVQKLIEILSTPAEISLVISALRPGAVPLILDLNGNHVVQRCLQCFSNEDNKFLLNAAADHCVEIATHRNGCCVLQRCVDYAKGEGQRRLVAQITINALVLSQDPFGNYVVQYILGMPWARSDVLNQLRGNYVSLSMQKFSSNVVEKCLKEADEDECAHIIQELLGSPNPLKLLQDCFGNYVIQSALEFSKGAAHAAIVDMVELHLPALRSNPYGKKMLARTKLRR